MESLLARKAARYPVDSSGCLSEYLVTSINSLKVFLLLFPFM